MNSFNSAEHCNFIWSLQIENYKERATAFVERLWDARLHIYFPHNPVESGAGASLSYFKEEETEAQRG